MFRVQVAPLVKSIIEERFQVKPGEKVCIVTDTEACQPITEALFAAAHAAGAKASVVTILPPKPGAATEPPEIAKAAMLAADVVINQSSQSFGHTDFVASLQKKGARQMVMVGLNEEMMLHGPASCEFSVLRDITLKAAEIVTNGKQVHLLTPEGTDLTFSIEGRASLKLYTEVSQPGARGAFPDGEAATAPVEGTAEGVIVNPYAIDFENIKVDMGFIKEPFRLDVRGGNVVGVSGGSEAHRFKEILDKSEPLARNLGEFAISTNPMARPWLSVRDAKKAWGLGHVGMGENVNLGGVTRTNFHLDIIFRQPTIIIDGRTVVEGGKLLV